MEFISFLGELFGYTPEIANVISVGGASFRFRKERHPPRMVLLLLFWEGGVRSYYKKSAFYALNCFKMPQQTEIYPCACQVEHVISM